MSTNDTQTLDPVAAGRLLGIGRSVTYRLIREGVIPTLRLGKKLRVPKCVIERMLACNEQQGGNACQHCTDRNNCQTGGNDVD